MPKAAFADLWKNIKAGNVWTGYVKNYAKSKDYYWVYATVYPYKSGDKTYYMSCRRKASKEETEEAELLYSSME